MDDDIKIEKRYDLCDYCSNWRRVSTQYLNGVNVNTYCKHCVPQESSNDSTSSSRTSQADSIKTQ